MRKSPCCASREECSGEGLCAARRADDVALIRDSGACRVGAAPGIGQVRGDLAAAIDHTLLKPDATREDLKKLCDEAKRYGFASVCVNSANVRVVKEMLRGSPVMAVAVVGFPLGAMSTQAKAFEAREAVRMGADEIDMVINIGALKSREYAQVEEDIRAVVQASRPHPVKVILETGALSQEEKIIGCALSRAAGAAFVKTSTGFGPGGATVEDVALMRRVVGDEMGVKASGGVRSTEDAEKMMKAGATRIGASASVAIVGGKNGKASGGKY
ncbi:MAG: deoxyribose-phosphate aldolase [Deltaproteobacteria bacterium]|nr:deoxyribose-phosphate aldolase [Deltaproteobacteria bacterium]